MPPPEQLTEELRKSRGIAELAQVLVNTARLEVDYISAVRGESDSAFLQALDERAPAHLQHKQRKLPTVDGLGGPAEHPLAGRHYAAQVVDLAD
jgi:hypothetical protein